VAVLITGAGLVGLQAARQLIQRGETVVLYDIGPHRGNIASLVGQGQVKVVRGDILDPLGLIRTIQQEGIDRVIHTVAYLPLARGRGQSPYPGIRVDLMGTVNVLEVARLLGLRRVVFTSSAMVYGPAPRVTPGPIAEEAIAPTIRHWPDNAYGISKFAAELYGLHYWQVHGVDFAAVRFSIVFGPLLGQVRGDSGMKMKELLRSAQAGQTIPLGEYQSWHGGVELVYSPDAGRSVALACFAENLASRVYNISMGRTYTLAEILHTLQELGLPVATQGEIDTTAPAPMPMDISRAREELGFIPEYDLEAALRHYLAWLAANPE